MTAKLFDNDDDQCNPLHLNQTTKYQKKSSKSKGGSSFASSCSQCCGVDK